MTFTDTKGRTWRIGFNCRSVRLLEESLGIRSLDFAGHFWPAYIDDVRAVDMVWCLVSEQAERLGIGMNDFLEALDQKALHAARESLMTEYIGFFRSPTKRGLLETLRTERRRLQEAMEAAIRSRLEAMLTSGAGVRCSSSPG